jgi:hypothetical protein
VARKLIAIVLFALLAGCGGSDNSPKAPATKAGSDFVGIYSDDSFFGDAAYRRRTLAQEHQAGVRLIRQPFAWTDFEREPARFDDFVAAAADAGIHVLPVLLGPEPSAASATGGMKPPTQPERFAGWAAQMVKRYGPDGSFWKSHPDVRKLPVGSWQVWNEPNIRAFWAPEPDPAAYAQLLRTTSAAIREADPDAEVVAAGLPTSHLGVAAPAFLGGVYKAGAKGTFDAVAVHPYAGSPGGVLERVKAIREVISANEDDAPIWITEFGWGTAGKSGPLTVSRDQQAAYVKETLGKLAAQRKSLGIRGAVLFQWRDPKPFPGRREIWPYHAGLLDETGRPKPGLEAFKQAAAAVK